MKITEKEYMEMIEMAKKNQLQDLLKFIDNFSQEEFIKYLRKGSWF